MRHLLTMTPIALCVSIAALSYNALAQDPDTQGSDTQAQTDPAVIEFASLGGIRDWRPAGSANAILIEGRNGRWYRASFMNNCPQIHYSETLAFVTDPTGDLTQFSSVLAGDQRCYFKTFERTNAPDEFADGEATD